MRSTSHSAASNRGHVWNPPCCATNRAFRSSAFGDHRLASVAAAAGAASAGPLHNENSHIAKNRPAPDVSCNAVLLAEPETASVAPHRAPVGTASEPPSVPQRLPTETVDIAVIGADVAGLAVALAAARAHPGASVVLYDTAAGPPASCDGGVLLSLNGLRALRALDHGLFGRLTTELAISVHEALWFDLEGELLRRVPLGMPSTSAAAAGVGGGSRRRSVMRRRPAAPAAAAGRAASSNANADLDASAPPLMVGLHELREALSDALPPEVEIYGRHHVRSVEPSPTGGALLTFAASPSSPPVRAVHARLVVGADGPYSALKRLQFDCDAGQQPQPSGRVVWRGRFTLRPRDPDFARLRNFTTASRTWVDLRAPPGSERTATLSPAGPNTFVWTASCPVGLLPSRGLKEPSAGGGGGGGGVSPYWRCLAMFEDFSQEFFAALRATAASAVVEYDAVRPPPPSVAAGLAAPWQWFAGPAALVGEAVYGMSADDAASTAANLALEDAAVLGSCLAAAGMTPKALQEYARQRGPRVSGLLSLPPSAPERLRLRDSPFLAPSPATQPPPASPSGIEQPSAPAVGGLTAAVAAAVDEAAAASVAAAAPPLAEILAKAAATTTVTTPLEMPINQQDQQELADMLEAVASAAGPSVDSSRPSGGASRIAAPGSGSETRQPALSPAAAPSAPSSPFFSRPSGARRMGPVPNAIAAVVGLLVAGGSKSVAPASAAVTAAAVGGNPAAAAAAVASPEALAAAPPAPYVVGSSPRTVWESLLLSGAGGGASSKGAGAKATAADAAAGSAQLSGGGLSGQYCAVQTPAAVWQALLVAPQTAHNALLAQPYKPTESPALVWAALLGATTAAVSTIYSPGGAPGSAASAAAPASTLLPRPVLKQKQAQTAAAAASEAMPAAIGSNGHETSPHPPQLQAPEPAAPAPHRAAVAAAAAAAPGQVRKERRVRGHAASPQAAAPAAAGIHRRAAKTAAKRSVAAAAAGVGGAATAAADGASRRAQRHASAVSNARAAAKAAATVTVSLSAAAALGGVISAGGGHVPVDMASAMHVHGAVAQFWDDLNNLTLSSASLSSMDV